MKEIVAELQKGNARRGDQANYAADDESDGDVPHRRLKKPKSKYPGVRRRPVAQNALSVFFLISPFLSLTSSSQRQIRAHMKSLIRKDDWLKEVVSEHDLNHWNPEIEECCTTQQFKLHLTGTPSDPWNSSAARVFTDDFLITHTELYPDVWAVRRMVLKKTRAYIKSLIRVFHQDNRGHATKQATKRAKNRYQRKADVSPLEQFSFVIL